MKTKMMGKDKSSFTVSPLALGCEYITEKTENIISEAMKAGINFFDTADIYGAEFTSEKTLGKVLSNYPRENYKISTKCGCIFTEEGKLKVNGTKAYIHSSCKASLQRLGLEYIDLFYLHRIDPNTPIEESVAAMAELVNTGLIKAIGLSEVSPEQIRRAHKIFPITAVQIEYSPWSQHEESNGVIEVCKELGVAVIAYSPLGRGFFVEENKAKYFETSFKEDYKIVERYNKVNLSTNLDLRKKLEAYVQEYEYNLPQFTLAWIMHKNIIPLFGTTNVKHMLENVKSAEIKVPEHVFEGFDRLIETLNFSGERGPKEWFPQEIIVERSNEKHSVSTLNL